MPLNALVADWNSALSGAGVESRVTQKNKGSVTRLNSQLHKLDYPFSHGIEIKE